MRIRWKLTRMNAHGANSNPESHRGSLVVLTFKLSLNQYSERHDYSIATSYGRDPHGGISHIPRKFSVVHRIACPKLRRSTLYSDGDKACNYGLLFVCGGAGASPMVFRRKIRFRAKTLGLAANLYCPVVRRRCNYICGREAPLARLTEENMADK